MSRRKFRKRGRRIWSPPGGASSKVWWAWYGEYLESRAWRIKRAERIAFDGGKCVLFQTTDGLQVHHMTYDDVGHESVDDLRTLCVACHKDHHDYLDKMRAKERERERAYNVAELEAHREAKKRKQGPFVQDLKTRRRPQAVQLSRSRSQHP